MSEIVEQVGLGLAWYLGLVAVMRLAGKRLAGQTTTFDLVVLITLGVVLQNQTLRPGVANGLTFIVTVFLAHRGLAFATARSRWLRRVLRGAPRPLIEAGHVQHQALRDESISYDELVAGLRKLGHEDPRLIRLAVLEETGHISAIPFDEPNPSVGGHELRRASS